MHVGAADADCRPFMFRVPLLVPSPGGGSLGGTGPGSSGINSLLSVHNLRPLSLTAAGGAHSKHPSAVMRTSAPAAGGGVRATPQEGSSGWRAGGGGAANGIIASLAKFTSGSSAAPSDLGMAISGDSVGPSGSPPNSLLHRAIGLLSAVMGRAFDAVKAGALWLWASALLPLIVLIASQTSATFMFIRAKTAQRFSGQASSGLKVLEPQPTIGSNLGGGLAAAAAQAPNPSPAAAPEIDLSIGPIIPLPSVQKRPIGMLHLRIVRAELKVPDNVW